MAFLGLWVRMKTAYYDNAADFMKIWLYVEGPEKILSWANTKDQTIDWEWKYAHICHSCLAIFNDQKVRKVVKEHYLEKVDEILLKYSFMVRSGNTVSPDLIQ